MQVIMQRNVTFLHCYAICKDAMVQNFILKKFQDIMQEFQDISEISGHSGQILKFQEFQDNAQACIFTGSMRTKAI